MRGWRHLLPGLVWLATAPLGHAAYADLVNFFGALHQSAQAAVFPVDQRGLADVEGAFGPRVQTSTGLYDWHRGIDVDGTLNVDPVLAALPGTFNRFETTASGGNTVVLEHKFADFLGGSVPSIEYGGKTLTRFYTWHLHLFDDGIAGNGIGTADLVAGFAVGDAVAAGTTIGILGNSGSAAAGGSGYGPHLHFELRVGTRASLEFQLENPATTQWGFDPHMNPMLLFAPATPATASLTTLAAFTGDGADAIFRFSADDEQPLLNRWNVRLIDLATGATVASHTLDYNQRLGFDATSTAALDTRDLTQPYVAPQPFGDTSTAFLADLVVPSAWLAGTDPGTHRLEVDVVDLWGNTVSTVAVPEPTAALLLAVAGVALASRARRRGNPAA